ncbi:DUF2878 domain-containing protein [Acerihabitans sp. TG2]|uniref:DUF2878 domain-containing protein n=1 Tax=Acerihabitans sp. TG2 TaxID=3096008 RepID=UPI002B23C8CD|nr:DUF2878 domain-containing protein [Acerihabitans sp. TG2]MEA9392550.1 DUF2878 domain-containing protein [Acerihabitans sp. TG2]
MKPLRFWLLSLGFDLWWTLAVWGRERLILPLLVSSLLMLALTPSRRRLWVVVACMLGIMMDSLWCVLGLFEFTHSTSVPPWMMALWLGFSAWWLWLLGHVQVSGYWLIPLGAVSGPVAYYVGMRFGAMHLLASPSYVWLLLAAGWALFLPLISLPVLFDKTRRRSIR